ncbi:hypothetical protein V1508DRAFT_77829 [Lipomyces doorenjongii]|uniref:uncharacterized protein n=1 Tax=Lipomyces doorenjongii TaxID=383834 RepID=UPI0034CE0D65
MNDISVSPRKHRQRTERINYHLLNDGSDEEALPEDRMVKKYRYSAPRSVELLTADDSTSQLTQRQSSPADSSHQPESTDDLQVDNSSVLCEPEFSRKKTQNQSLWEQFDAIALSGKLWCRKRGKGPLEDREIRCTRCNWRTTDSARATSTSNMRFHLTKYGIFSNGSESGLEDDRSSTKQPSIASFFQKRAEDNAGKFLERNLVRWVVLNNMKGCLTVDAIY